MIGSSVEAAYYALVNEYYFIPTRKMPPMFYNKLQVPLLGSERESDVWPKLNIMMGLLSRRLTFNQSPSIRVTDNIIKIATQNTTFKYSFDKLYVFDPTGVQFENDIKISKRKTFIVLDDFELSNMGPKRYELSGLCQQNGFARKLHFYSSDRVDGSSYITDCVVESELNQQEINCFEYSDSMVRFVVERHLKSLGVHGILMKYYDSGKPKYRKPKVTHVKRMVFEKDNNIYEDSQSVKFINLSLREILEESSKG